MAKQFQSLVWFVWGSDSQELIRTYLKAAEKAGRFWQRRFPRDDFEARAMSALYSAAATYRPGSGSFYSWFCWKLRGQVGIAVRRIGRKPTPYSIDHPDIESRLTYTDREQS